jgi:hypothetical protein
MTDIFDFIEILKEKNNIQNVYDTSEVDFGYYYYKFDDLFFLTIENTREDKTQYLELEFISENKIFYYSIKNFDIDDVTCNDIIRKIKVYRLKQIIT